MSVQCCEDCRVGGIHACVSVEYRTGITENASGSLVVVVGLLVSNYKQLKNICAF